MPDPIITVLMPVYNGERFLKDAIESILQQSFVDFEFFIIDDGSTDRTAEILQGYHDNRMKVVYNQRNQGLTRCLNQGLALAAGKYIARQDADDISARER